MKVLLVNGSPHKEGCTYTALKEVEKTLQEAGVDTEIFWIGAKPISGCMGCRQCVALKKCVIDDVVNEFVDKAKQADGFIFGSPVHYAGICGGMTSFMDRAFFSDPGEAFAFKPASAVLSARRAGTTAAYDQMNKYFGISQMPIISSRYWNMVHGSVPEEVLQDEEGLQVMRMLGRNMAYYLQCIEAGKEKGIMPPPPEKKVCMTNFIR